MASPSTAQLRRLIRNEITRLVRLVPSATIHVAPGDHPLQPSVIGGGGGGGDVSGPASAVDDNIATFDGTTGKLIQDSGSAISDFGDVDGPASAVDERVAVFDGTSGKLIKDGGVTVPGSGFGDVVGPSSATDNAIAVWDTTTGKLLQDSSLIIIDGGGIIVLSTPDGAPADELSIEPGNSTSGAGADLDLRGGDADAGAAGDVTITGGSQLPGSSPTGGNIDLFATNARAGSALPGGIIRLQGGTNDDGSGPAFVHVRTSDLKVDGDVFANAFIATASSMTFTAPSGQTVDTIVDVTTVLEVAEALITVNVDLDMDGNDIDMGGGSLIDCILVTSTSAFSLITAAGGLNSILFIGGSNAGANGSNISFNPGAVTSGDGDGGSVTIALPAGSGSGDDGEFRVTDAGSVVAIRVTGASTPVVEIGRSLNPLANIVLQSGDRIGPGTSDSLIFLTGSSATFRVNTQTALLITDTAVEIPATHRLLFDGADTSIRASAADTLVVEIDGNDEVVFTAMKLTLGDDGTAIYEIAGVTRATGDVSNLEFVGADATSAGNGQSFRFHCGNAATTGSHDGGGFTIDLGALAGVGTGGQFVINASGGSALLAVLNTGGVQFGAGTNINSAGVLDMDGANIIDADNILVLDGGIIGSGVNDNFVINVGTDITFTVNSVNCLDITPTTLDGKSVLRLVNFAGRREVRQWGFPSSNTATNRSLEGLTRSNHGNGGVFTPNRPGSIVGMNGCIDVNVIGSGGDIEFQVRKNGSTVYTVTLVAPGVANKHQVHDTQAVGVDTFVAGDIIEVRRVLVNGGAGQITTDDTEMDVEFEFDT